MHFSRAGANGRSRHIDGRIVASIILGNDYSRFASGGSGHVDGNISAPDDDDSPTDRHFVAKVDVQKKVDTVDAAIGFHTFDRDVPPLLSPDREIDSREFTAKVSKLDLVAYTSLGMNLDPDAQQRFDFGL